MGSDFSMMADLGGPELVEIDGMEDVYVSHNIGPMFRKATEGICYKDFDKMPAKKCKPILEKAIKNMETSPDDYKKLDAPNNWGNSEQLLKAFKTLLNWCNKAPNGIMYNCY